MAIVKFDNVTIKNVINSVDAVGQYTTTLTDWFKTRGIAADVTQTLKISEKYRVYDDLFTITLNYTPNTRHMADNHHNYAIAFRGKDWRIVDIYETNDKMKVRFLCYHNDPSVRV